MSILELDAVPHNCIPYVGMGNTAVMIILMAVNAVKHTTNRIAFLSCTTCVTLVDVGMNSDVFGIDDCTKTLS